MSEAPVYVLKNKRVMTEGDFEYFPYDDGTATLLRCIRKSGDIVVPSEAGGYTVVDIGSLAFTGCDGVTSIEVAPTVRTIGNRAFEGCANLRKLTLSDSLESLSGSMFTGCTSFREFIIPDDITRLEGRFLNGLSLDRLVVGAGAQVVDPMIFASASIGELVVSEDNPWFASDGNALLSKDRTVLYALAIHPERYEVPSGVTEIGEKAFASKGALVSVKLPDSLASIGQFAFTKSGLASVDIPASTLDIGEKAFYCCADLAQLTLRHGVRRIGAEAFARTALNSLAIPNTVDFIGYDAFAGTGIRFHGDDVTATLEEGNGALFIDGYGGIYQKTAEGLVLIELLDEDVSVYAVQPGTVRIGSRACRLRKNLEHVIIPEGVKAIGDSAFRNCRALTEVDLPESLEDIEDKAFLDTSVAVMRFSGNLRHIGERALLIEGENLIRHVPPLQRIDLDPANERFYIVNGLFCERGVEGDTLLLYLGPDPIVEVPEQVTRIAEYAFCNATTLREIYLHAHITSIGFAAFEVLKPLEKISFDLGVPIDGCAHDEVYFPDDQYTTCRAVSSALSADENGLIFDYDVYDRYILLTRGVMAKADLLIARLEHPVQLSPMYEEYFRKAINGHLREVCCTYAERDDIASLTRLIDLGFVDGENIEKTIEDINEIGETYVTGFLLDMQRERFGKGAIELGLDL